MKISKIYIRYFEQFQDVELDFTDPNTGEPLEKVCFIGTNGTGKSKILKMLNGFLNSVLFQLRPPFRPLLLGDNIEAKIIYEIVHIKKKYVIFYFEQKVEILDIEGYQKDRKSALLNRLLSLESMDEIKKFPEYSKLIEGTRHTDFLNELIPGNNSNDLVIYSPDESTNNGYLAIADVPQTNVNDALSLFQNLPVFVEVSPNTVNDFWKLLVFNLKKRDDEREKYERNGENINKTKAQLINEFDEISPKILDNLAVIWDKILDKASLEFDVQGASNPIQLSDNLKAYVRLKKSKKIVPYRNLSTGIRNFIFRVGHIYSLYFNRQVNRGFLFIDEPENGFFPDFLFDLMKTYQNITIDKNGNNNTQMFFATHNPIVAGQFQPYERIILDWNEDNSVVAKKGVSPVGDDPNDVLSNDFELKDLMGPDGRKMWEKYQNLKKNLIREKDNSKKEDLINQINQIGSLYNFSQE
jgi:energy-coupling factor transporter ATP-binding protein EcfA2